MNLGLELARPAGFEPATPALEGRRSIQLNYARLVSENPLTNGRARVQWGAMRHGIAGIHGNHGVVESVTYRI